MPIARVVALIALACSTLAPTAAAQVVAGDSVYATKELRALVGEAAERNKLPDDLLSYDAQVETEIGVLGRRAGGAEGVAAVEQVASELRWTQEGGGRTEQHITGYRSQQIGLNFSVLSIFRTGWVTPTLYGGRLRVQAVNDQQQRSGGPPGRRRRVRRDTIVFIHPLADDREQAYRFRGGDTVVTITVNGREVPIVRVRVEPRAGLPQRTGVFTGDIDLDATRRQVVRMRGSLGVVGGRRRWSDRLPGGGVQAVGYIEYVNAEFDARYWLPSYQRLELQAAVPAFGEGRAIIRFVSQIREHRINGAVAVASVPPADSARGRARLTYASRDSLERYEAWRGALGATIAQYHADDFDDLAPDAWRPTGRPRVDLQVERFADVFHFNRIEGAYTGAGVTVRPRDAAPGVTVRANAGWAWSEQTARGRINGAIVRGRWQLSARAGRTLDITNDFRNPFDSGSTLAPLLASVDDYDYVDRRMAALSVGRAFGAARGTLLHVEAGVGSDRGVSPSIKQGVFKGDSGFRPNRGVDGGRYVRTAATLEYHPDVNAEFVRPGVNAAVNYERGDGDLDWQRVEVRLMGRRTWGQMTYAARFDAGAVISDAPPPQQLFELGQNQNLPGYEYKEFAGDRAALARALAMYSLPFFNSPIRLIRRWILPSPSPALAAGVQAGWTEVSDAAAAASIRRLGIIVPPPGSGTTPPANGGDPVSRPTDGVRTSVNVGLRFFGGAVFVGTARPLDRGAAWKLSLSFAQQL